MTQGQRIAFWGINFGLMLTAAIVVWLVAGVCFWVELCNQLQQDIDPRYFFLGYLLLGILLCGLGIYKFRQTKFFQELVHPENSVQSKAPAQQS